MGSAQSVSKPISIDQLFNCIASNNIDLFKEVYDIVIKHNDKDLCINYKDVDTNNRSALMIACLSGYTEIVSILLNAGALVNDIDDKGYTCLMLAADKGYIDIVKLLLDGGVDKDMQTITGDTALILATNNNRYEIVNLLVNAGANTSLCTKLGGNDAFAIAMRSGSLSIIKLLYKDSIDINMKDIDGKYPLMYASINGHDEVIKWLRTVGANVDAVDDNGFSAIFFASSHGNNKCVEVLLKGKGKANVNLRNKYGNTCLFKALESSHLKIVQTLMNSGADVDNVNNFGITPIMQAAWIGKLNCLQYLIERKASLNHQDNKGNCFIINTNINIITNTIIFR